MDFRLKNLSKIRSFPTRQDGMRVMAERAPQAEALALSCVEKLRPLAVRVYALRRRLATIAVAVIACFLFVHVMFGANGMMVYKQKRAEYESLQKRVVLEQKENETYAHKIQALKTDEKAIEKEAREQMRYARPGEYVYVSPPPASTPVPLSHSAKK
jgi:cell division protein FtsB